MAKRLNGSFYWQRATISYFACSPYTRT